MADDAAPNQEQAPEAATTRPFSLLASERFGSQYVGEVPKEPETIEETEEVTEEVAEEATEEVPDDTPTETEETTEEVPISSVQELIEQNEYDPEWFNTLKVPVKVDGKTAEATLSDLVKSYQIGEAAEKRLEEAKSKAKALNQELTQKSESLQERFAVVAKLVENAEAMLGKDSESVNWAKLREDDPAEYSAKKTELKERRESIEQLKREAGELWQQSIQERQQQSQAEQAERIAHEQQLLLQKIPEWQDQEKAAEGKKKLVEYLVGQGFSQEDVLGASDHRLILMSRKAMLYDELQSKTDVAKKKVAKVPKVLKPGAPRSKEHQSREKLDKLKSNLRKTGSIDDALSLLRAKRGGT